MTKHLVTYCTDILRDHISSSLDEGICLGSHCKRDTCTRRSAIRYEVCDLAKSVILRSTGSIDDIYDISLDLLIHVHILHHLTGPYDILGLEDRLSLRECSRIVHADDLTFFLLFRICHHYLEHETVKLRLWERIGTFLFDRVLSSHHEERLRKLESLLTDCHLTLLHRLQKSRLHLRRRTVDLIGQHEISEDRTFLYLELLSLLRIDQSTEHIGRKKVRSKLDTVEL